MPQTAAIEVKNLRFRWRKALPEVLRIETLEVARGERIFIRGASGS
ncbi:MAG: ABC transporter ATP-binding protein, partial [gamma proteobacterium symbiont of Ctena orbiculata]